MSDLISRSALIAKIKPPTEDDYDHTVSLGNVRKMLLNFANSVPSVDAVEVDVVAQMFYDFTGDLCPCNFNGNDEWLPEVCELLNECPNPSGDKLGCWKQYIKHFQPRKEG